MALCQCGPAVFSVSQTPDITSPNYAGITQGYFGNGVQSYSQNFILSGAIVSFQNAKTNFGAYESVDAQIVQTASALGE